MSPPLDKETGVVDVLIKLTMLPDSGHNPYTKSNMLQQIEDQWESHLKITRK